MLRVAWRNSLRAASLVVVAWTGGCGDDQSAGESKHGHGGRAGAGGAAVAGLAGVAATGGASGTTGAGNGGTAAGARAGSSAGSDGGSSGASAGRGEGGTTDGGEGGQGGGEGGASAGEGGEAGSGAVAGAGGMGMAGAGAGMGGTGGAVGGAGAGGAGRGGAGAGVGGGGGTGGASIPGLDVPCQNGPGWTLFRWHYGNNGTTAIVDVWDATCSYSASSSSTCTIETVQSTSLVHSNTAILIDGSNELRARFSVQGLAFTGASVHVRARSYSTNASTNILVESFLHGYGVMGPVDQDFTFDWYGMDWSANLLPTDTPLGTTVRIYPFQGSNALAVMSVELCLR